jgi:hypothetical protein
MSAKKPPTSSKQTPNSASDRSITASTVRPVNRARRELSSQAAGRNSRNSAGMRTGSFFADAGAKDGGPPPYGMRSPPSFLCLLLGDACQLIWHSVTSCDPAIYIG